MAAGVPRWNSLAVLVLVSTAGCQALVAPVYLLKGHQHPPECTALEEQRVVVVCRRPPSVAFRDGAVDRELAKAVGRLLAENLKKKKIDVVDHRDVEKWIDEEDWDEVGELARAVGASRALEIDLEEFDLHRGQMLLQGKAVCTLYVHDITEEGTTEIWSKPLGQTLFPREGGVHSQEKPEPQFRRQFLGVLADEIARHFYEHDAYIDFATDSAAHHL